jgi:hypothetical protein
MQVVKVHDVVTHQQNTAHAHGNRSLPTPNWEEGDDELPRPSAHSSATHFVLPGTLGPASPLNKYTRNVNAHDSKVRQGMYLQEQADKDGGLGVGDRLGRNDVMPDVHDVQYVDNSDLNKLAANNDMTLQVGVNEQWGANLSPHQ